MRALSRANEIRAFRAALHREIAAMTRRDGAWRCAALLRERPTELDSLTVYSFLLWIRRVGKSQARGILRTAAAYERPPMVIAEGRRLDQLSPRQVDALILYLRGYRV